MFRQTINEGWRFGERVSAFEAFLGGANETVEVTLPHDAMLAGGRSAESANGSHSGYFNPGAWTYTKELEVPAEWENQRVILEFEGVYRDAMVYVNGDLAGQCAYGYTRFRVPLDSHLRYGQTNSIKVEAQAHQDARWYTGGGIHRPVHLLVGPLIHIDPAGPRVKTLSCDSELAAIEIAVPVVNSSHAFKTVNVSSQVIGPNGKRFTSDVSVISVAAGETAVVRQRIHVENPDLWNVDTPNIYTAKVRLEGTDIPLDQASSTFGIRDFTVDPVRGLRINGEVVKLRGACIHSDNGVLGGAAFGDADRRRIALLKEAGFNAIRSAHNPLSVSMLDACDALGMVVMDETWDVWSQGKTSDDYSLRFANWWKYDVESMVEKDYNHPSVLFYSIGNEIQEVGTPHGARRGRMIAEYVRELDSSRLVTNGIHGMMTVIDVLAQMAGGAGGQEPGEDALGFNDIMGSVDGVFAQIMQLPQVSERISESAGVLDVVGLNYADQLYLSEHEKFPNRVIVGTETFPARIDKYWELITNYPHVIGDFTWAGWDYLGEAGVARPVYPGEPEGMGGPYPWLAAHSGDFDITGIRRPRSFYREVVFGLRTDPYIAVQRPEHHHEAVSPHSWVWSDSVNSWTWNVETGTPIVVEAYCDGDEVEFLTNGNSVARVPVGQKLAKYATADITYEPGILEAVAYRGGVEIGRTRLVTAVKPQSLRLTVEEAPEGFEENPELLFVRIETVDAAGMLNPAFDYVVNVEVEGGASLQGLGTGRACHEESYLDSKCTTFNGSALAVLRRTSKSDVTVTVKSDGLATAVKQIR